MPLTIDDTEIAGLIAATAAGSRDAFRTLYERTSPKLLGVILRMRVERAAAEDILQDVYVRIWRKAGQYAPEAGPPWGWMIAIARNSAIDALRRRTPDLLPPGDDGSDWLEREADPRDAAAQWMDGQALQHCLERVEPAVRDCIVLAYCEGWSREELGARFGRPPNTIKTWLHRGLAILRTCLDET